MLEAVPVIGHACGIRKEQTIQSPRFLNWSDVKKHKYINELFKDDVSIYFRSLVMFNPRFLNWSVGYLLFNPNFLLFIYI